MDLHLGFGLGFGVAPGRSPLIQDRDRLSGAGFSGLKNGGQCNVNPVSVRV
jgi:hypothetical protein